jgi:hypothetical protein
MSITYARLNNGLHRPAATPARTHHIVTIVVPEFIPAQWWQQLLHNQTALLIKGQLLFHKNVVVTEPQGNTPPFIRLFVSFAVDALEARAQKMPVVLSGPSPRP